MGGECVKGRYKIRPGRNSHEIEAEEIYSAACSAAGLSTGSEWGRQRIKERLTKTNLKAEARWTSVS